MGSYAIIGELHAPEHLIPEADSGLEVLIGGFRCLLLIATVREMPTPLKVGDTLDRSSVEPPDGTVVLSARGLPYRREGDYWYVPGSTMLFRWKEDVTPQASGPLRVIHVPEEWS